MRYDDDNDNPNEQDAFTNNLLNEICKGVEIPTDEESEKAFHEQH